MMSEQIRMYLIWSESITLSFGIFIEQQTDIDHSTFYVSYYDLTNGSRVSIPLLQYIAACSHFQYSVTML